MTLPESEKDLNDGWDEEEPLSSDIYAEFKPLWLPLAYDEFWPHSFQNWAVKVDGAIRLMRTVVRSPTLVKALERLGGCLSALCREVWVFLLKTDQGPMASLVSQRLEEPLPQYVEPMKPGQDVASAWSAARSEIIWWTRRINELVVQFPGLPEIAVPVEEITRLSASQVPLFELSTRRIGQRIVVVVDGEQMPISPNAGWFLATAGLAGFENKSYRDDSLEDLWSLLEERSYREVRQLATRIPSDKSMPKHYSKYEISPALRSRILPKPGPELLAIQDELQRLLAKQSGVESLSHQDPKKKL